MASLQSVGFGHLWDQIKAILSAIGNFLLSFFQAEAGITENIDRITTDFHDTKQSLTDGIARIRDFKFDIQWRTRVISIPQAEKRLKHLWETTFKNFKKKIDTLEAPFFAFKTTFAHGGHFDPSDHVNGLTKVTTKITEISQLISQVADAMDQIKDWADAFDEIITDFETLDDIFLQQDNPRQTLKKKVYKRIRQ
jgi:hypothetical protein